MNWSSIPNFGDEYAKVNERTHSSGARVIEVLYGARDSEGRRTSPENRDVDGHGHWIALEIDGTFQILLWRHPKSEGGQQEYGISESANPLMDLEHDINLKESICMRVESIANLQSTTSKEINHLLEEWKKIYNWGTPREQQLWERFQRAQNSFYERREKEKKMQS